MLPIITTTLKIDEVEESVSSLLVQPVNTSPRIVNGTSSMDNISKWHNAAYVPALLHSAMDY
jgi:hypothetical protein